MGASVFSFVGFSVAELFFQTPLLSNPSLLDDLSNPALIPALRVMQVFQAVGMLILPSLVFLWVTNELTGIGSLFKAPNRQGVLISISFFLVAFPLVNFLAEWNSGIELPALFGDWMQTKESNAQELTELFLDMPTIWLLLFNLLMIAVLPAIGEELIFRGIVQRGLHRQFGNAHLAIWISAALFSAIHLQFFGFVPRMLMGVAMGYLLFWSGNLWYPIIAHLTNNAMSVILAYGIQHGHIEAEIEHVGLTNGTLASFSLVFCFMLLYLFKQHETSSNSLEAQS